MTKKMFIFLIGSVLLMFVFSITMNVSLLAQDKEEQKGEDIEDFSLEDLLNVEITTASKQAQKISDIPASVVVVTRAEIEKYGYEDLSDVLSNIPGLYMVDDGLNKNFGVRGFFGNRANRNLSILVNGIPQREDSFSGNFLEHIAMPVEAIDRIEVVRGPMSVIYGSGAFFGVINIITNIVDQKPVSMITASYGSEQTKKVAVRSSGKSGDFQYAFSGSFFGTNGLDEPYSAMVSGPGVLTAFGLTEDQTTGGQLEKNSKYFNFSGDFKGFYFDASYSENYEEILFTLPPVAGSSGNYGIWKSMRLGIGYKKKFSEKLSLDSKFSYLTSRWQLGFEVLLPNYYGVEDDDSYSYNAEMNLFWNPTSKLSLQFGLNLYKIFDVAVDFDHPLFGLNNFRYTLVDGDSIETQSILTQITYNLSDKFKVVVGGRLERVPAFDIFFRIGVANPSSPGFGTNVSNIATSDQSGVEFIPRAALIYSPIDKHVFKLLYGKAINRPGFYQATDILNGHDQLEPEEIQTLELSYIGQISKNISIGLNLFRNMLDKLIFRTYIIRPDHSLFTSEANVGKMSTNGVEMTFTAIPTKNLFFEFSGTLQDTKDKRLTGIDVGYSPKFLGYIKTSYSFTNDISLAVTGNYVGKMEAYYDETLAVPGRIGQNVDGYFLLGANLRLKNLFRTGLFLNLRGSNLLDQEVRYPTTSNNSNYITRGTFGRSRSFLLTMGWEF